MNEKELRAQADKVLAAYIFALSAKLHVTENVHYWTRVSQQLRESVFQQLQCVAQQAHTFAYKKRLLYQLEALLIEHAQTAVEERFAQEAEITLLMQRITRPARNPYRLKQEKTCLEAIHLLS